MEVDEALMKLGKFGRYQVILYVVISVFTTFPSAMHMLAIVFIGAMPPHRCVLPPGYTDLDVPEEFDEIKNELVNSSCALYVNRSQSNATMDCPQGYEYFDDYGETIVTEWTLVCEKKYLSDMSQTVMVAGVMIGAMFFSFLSDHLGRKPVFLFSNWAMLVVGVITAFTTNYYFFCVMRFLTGMLQQGIMLTGFILACELFPANYRTFAGTAIENFWALAMCVFALLAYLVRNWRHLQLLISVPMVLSISLFWILPESIPWLVAKSKHREAEQIIRRAAKVNRVQMPDKILASPESETLVGGKDAERPGQRSLGSRVKNCCLGLGVTVRSLFKKEKKEGESEAAKYTILDVFRHRKLTIYALIMAFLWFVNSLVYYGLSLSTGVSAGDRYLNFFLSGLVEIPAYTSTIFVLAKWGRRWPLCAFHIIAGVALLLSMCVPAKTPGGTDLEPLIIAFNMIGKFGITGSFGTVFLYAPEIFPTTLRNQMIGFCSVGGRLGNILAPFTATINRIMPIIPGVLFGSLSVGVGLLALLLPETLGRPLPQTIEDIDQWSKVAPAKKQKNEKGKTEVVDTGNDVTDKATAL